MKALLAAAALATASAAFAQKQVTIAYQDMVVPYRVAQEAKEIEKATGYRIEWKQFGGGGEVIKAMASGQVQIGEVGSAPLASAISRGLPLELFWILDDIGDAEALVARNGSGIDKLEDLKGKRLATPFASTGHFHAMVALELAKLKASDVKFLNMRPPEIAAAWDRGDVDATYIWDPVLSKAKASGKVIITSGQITARTGKATFDGMAVNRDWAKANGDFLVAMIKVMAAADERYRANKAAWTKDSPEVKAVAKWSGAKPEDVPAAMALYAFPTMKEQAEKWLGGGKNSLAARAFAATAQFLVEQKQLEKALADYSIGVNPSYVQRAMK
ncbi:MAG: taurine ABC transporter substrate-binding protein [Burkholderiales bacterium]|nr:taurine ABC transporter substrate-binding protein [Burkholderiales bacterium]